MKKQFSIIIKNELSEIGRVIGVFERFQEFHKLAKDVVNAVQVALDEMISNIILYAYEGKEEHEIFIKVRMTDAAIILQIRDDGIKFNPFSSTQTKADIQSSLEERPIGGLGVYLVTSLMDSCEYHYRNKQNCSIMKKKLKL